MKRPRIIKNWRDAWKWYSIHMPMLSAALLATWVALPDQLQQSLSPLELKAVAIVLIVLGVIGRLIDQSPKKAEGNRETPS